MYAVSDLLHHVVRNFLYFFNPSSFCPHIKNRFASMISSSQLNKNSSLIVACPFCPEFHRAVFFSFAPMALITVRAIIFFCSGVSSLTSLSFTNLLTVYPSIRFPPLFPVYLFLLVCYAAFVGFFSSIFCLAIRMSMLAFTSIMDSLSSFLRFSTVSFINSFPLSVMFFSPSFFCVADGLTLCPICSHDNDYFLRGGFHLEDFSLDRSRKATICLRFDRAEC